MKNQKSIMWFRYDLRVSDNEALTKAMEYNKCYPIYIVDTSQRELGGASQVWLNHALKDLNESLSNSLSIFIGQPNQIISNLVKNHSINSVYFDHTYDPAIEQSDQNVIQALNQLDCSVITTNQRTLWDIRHLFKYDQEIYTVFSPFFRKGCLKDSEPAKPKQLNITKNIEKFSESNSIDNIIPIPNHQWTKSITNHWPISESGAQKVWKTFRENGLIGYNKNEISHQKRMFRDSLLIFILVKFQFVRYITKQYYMDKVKIVIILLANLVGESLHTISFITGLIYQQRIFKNNLITFLGNLLKQISKHGAMEIQDIQL